MKPRYAARMWAFVRAKPMYDFRDSLVREHSGSCSGETVHVFRGAWIYLEERQKLENPKKSSVSWSE